MAATALAEQPVLGAYVKEGETQFTTLTMTESDSANMNKVVMSTGMTLLIIQNTDGANAEWTTIYASDDAYGRSTDITEQDTPAASWSMYLFQAHGWEQTLGGRDLLIDTESTDVDLLAIPV